MKLWFHTFQSHLGTLRTKGSRFLDFFIMDRRGSSKNGGERRRYEKFKKIRQWDCGGSGKDK